MASLRTRVLASVCALAAVGLVILAVVTYAEQSSFLHSRLDQEVVGANPALSHALDEHGYKPAEGHTNSDSSNTIKKVTPHLGNSDDQGPHGPAAVALLPPPGTYSERKEASGKRLGSPLEFNYGQTAPPRPKIPVHFPLKQLFTVGSMGSSGLRYRVYVQRDREDSGLTLVAVPLREVDQTLSRLLLVETLVIVGVLLALAVSAFFVVRVGLRPLDRMEVTAGKFSALNCRAWRREHGAHA